MLALPELSLSTRCSHKHLMRRIQPHIMLNIKTSSVLYGLGLFLKQRDIYSMGVRICRLCVYLAKRLYIFSSFPPHRCSLHHHFITLHYHFNITSLLLHHYSITISLSLHHYLIIKFVHHTYLKYLSRH